jgi:hypothetical protein
MIVLKGFLFIYQFVALCVYIRGVFKKRPNFVNSASTGTESALRLLGAPSGRFWQQIAICPVPLWTLRGPYTCNINCTISGLRNYNWLVGRVLKTCAMIEETLSELKIYCASILASIFIARVVLILRNNCSVAVLSPWRARLRQENSCASL